MLYRFIAAPANKTKQQTYDLLKQAIANPPSADYAEISVVEVPEFKVKLHLIDVISFIWRSRWAPWIP